MQKMNRNKIRQQRIDTLFDECRNNIITSTLSAFGLNMGMFTDRDGGNVTTEHNFERDDNQFVHERDHIHHEQAMKTYERNELEIKKDEWSKKRTEKVKLGIDEYTGEKLDPNRADLDHIKPLKEINDKKSNHLAFKTGTTEGKEKLKKVANSDQNLAITDSSINRSKGADSNSQYLARRKKNNENNPDVDTKREQRIEENMTKKEKAATDFIQREHDKELREKQKAELVETGWQQGKSMAIKQALGVLSTKVINILFNEIKLVVKESNELNTETFVGIKQRLSKHSLELAKSLPSILGEAIKGGISGFVSNLLTFLINNFLSTVKRIVIIIREGLLGVYNALKIILFPPKGITVEEKWKTATKLLSTTVITSVITSFTENITTFISAIPFSDILGAVLAGLFSGLISAVAAYAIDRAFDKFFDKYDEEMIDLLLKNSEKQKILSFEIERLINTNFKILDKYDSMIKTNKLALVNIKQISNNTNKVSCDTNAIAIQLNELIQDNSSYIEETKKITDSVNNNYDEIERFLSKHIL